MQRITGSELCGWLGEVIIVITLNRVLGAALVGGSDQRADDRVWASRGGAQRPSWGRERVAPIKF
jgi:hypothetical protein